MPENAVDFFRETEIMLEQWGRWCRTDGNKINYPSIAPFAKEMPRDIEGTLALMSDSDAHEIECAMLQLKKCNAAAYSATLYRYVRRLTLLEISKKSHCSYSKSRADWKAGVFFVMGSCINKQYKIDEIT
jgi:hypothetical protein